MERAEDAYPVESSLTWPSSQSIYFKIPCVSMAVRINSIVLVRVSLSNWREPFTPVNWRISVKPRVGFCCTRGGIEDA
jgi:hypothetical protein